MNEPNIISLSELAQSQDPAETLRQDLQDASKDYDEIDVIIELLQNALDAVDYKRYKLICDAANLDPKSDVTIEKWNDAIGSLLDEDYTKYTASWSSSTPEVSVAALYSEWSMGADRRKHWWDVLGTHFDVSGDCLAEAVSQQNYQPKLIVRYWPTHRFIEIEDHGIGMDLKKDNALCFFRHKGSTKRSGKGPKRYGERGDHGWGLTAVLAYADNITISSRVVNEEIYSWEFKDFQKFKNKGLEPTLSAIVGSEQATLLQDASLQSVSSGTVVRLVLQGLSSSNPFSYIIEKYNSVRFINFLRLFTPVAQLNDYLLHPAYHCYRKDDPFTVEYKDMDNAAISPVEYDFLRLKDISQNQCFGFDQYKDTTSSVQGISVHTVHRHQNAQKLHILSAAEIQETKLFDEFQKTLKDASALPAFGDQEKMVEEIPRGFYLGYSGGMLSRHRALDPTGNNAMFRGIVLAEQSPPTLARKSVSEQMDGRSSIPRACKEHTNKYEPTRAALKKTLGGPTGPALGKAIREYFDDIIIEMRNELPVSESLSTWATWRSKEARVMLLFAELLGRGTFGNLHIIRCGLRDQYDFGFYYTTKLGIDSTPSAILAAQLEQDGWVERSQKNTEMRRLGIGEFKAEGQDIFGEFEPTNRIKNANAIDLLVCWDFDQSAVTNQSWTNSVTQSKDQEYPLQTHTWEAQAAAVHKRNRPLAIIALKDVTAHLVTQGNLDKPSPPWPPFENYY